MSQERYWFAPKVVGYGSGLPIAWQGWVIYAAFLVAIVLVAVFVPKVWWFAGFGCVTVVFGAICWRKTEGGWRWRP